MPVIERIPKSKWHVSSHHRLSLPELHALKIVWTQSVNKSPLALALELRVFQTGAMYCRFASQYLTNSEAQSSGFALPEPSKVVKNSSPLLRASSNNVSCAFVSYSTRMRTCA